MMRYDKAWAFLENAAITATGTKVIRITVSRTGANQKPGVAGWGIAQMPQVWIWAGVTVGFNRLTSLALKIDAIDGSNVVPIVPNVTTVLASLAQGAVLINQAFPIVEEAIDAQSLRLTYTVAGTAPTAGKITCVLKADQGDALALVGDVLTERLPSSYDAFPGPSS